MYYTAHFAHWKVQNSLLRVKKHVMLQFSDKRFFLEYCYFFPVSWGEFVKLNFLKDSCTYMVSTPWHQNHDTPFFQQHSKQFIVVECVWYLEVYQPNKNLPWQFFIFAKSPKSEFLLESIHFSVKLGTNTLNISLNLLCMIWILKFIIH